METLNRRPTTAGTTPSRYKSVRRKPTNSSIPAAPPPLPAGLPQIPGQRYIPIQKESPVPSASTAPTSAPSSRPSTAHAQDDSDHAHQHEHQSRFRKMLRLRTKHIEGVQSPPRTAGGSAIERDPPADYARREETRYQSPVVPPRSPPSPEEMERQRARDDAVAALEGKKRPVTAAGGGSKPQANHGVPAAVSPTVPTTKCDMTVNLHFEHGAPATTGIAKATSAKQLLEQVRPGHSRVLVESWPSLGLERPMRYFEQVSDILDTWDFGTTSHLRVSKSCWGASSKLLSDFPPTLPPSGEKIFYYYVTSDKKWQKRTISIEEHQIRICKKDRPQDKDHFQFVSLDDFDIYTFSPDVYKPDKKLRCPTKFCFALKSRYKQSIFGKNTVFVHYFAIDDENLFLQWHGLIRDTKTRLLAEKANLAPWVVQLQTTDSRPGTAHQKPLIDPSDLAPPPPSLPGPERSKSLSRSKSLARSKSTRQNGAPPQTSAEPMPPLPKSRYRSVSAATPRSRSRPPVPTAPTPLIQQDQIFSPTSLLGQNYEAKRAAALRNYKDEIAHNAVPFSTSRPGTSNGPTEIPGSSGGLSRSLSRPGTAHRPGDGPLLDFSTSPPPLPAHLMKRGRGYTTDNPTDGNLISHATQHSPSDTLSRSATTRIPRSVSQTRNYQDQTGFTGAGLLQGGKIRTWEKSGHGVGRGTDVVPGVGRPLVDVKEQSVFVAGSLLEERERRGGGPGREIVLGQEDGGEGERGRRGRA